MKYIYQCYFYVFVGEFSFYRKITKCGPLHSTYHLALNYLEEYKQNERNFCTGFIYEFLLDSILDKKLIYTTDPFMEQPDIFLNTHYNNNDNKVTLNR